MKNRVLFGLILFAYSAFAMAGGMGPMWIFPVGRLCIAQNPQYADTFLGNFILDSRMKLTSQQFTQCAHAHQWIPKHICSELMSLETGPELSRANLERLGAQWSKELKVLRVAGPYVEDASEAEIAGQELPSCP